MTSYDIIWIYDDRVNINNETGEIFNKSVSTFKQICESTVDTKISKELNWK